MSLNILQLSIVHRLPQSYRWRTGFTGSSVEPIAQNDPGHENHLIGLKLLGYDCHYSRPVGYVDAIIH